MFLFYVTPCLVVAFHPCMEWIPIKNKIIIIIIIIYIIYLYVYLYIYLYIYIYRERDSPEWLKNKKATINPKTNDGNCFQYAIIAGLNHKQIKNHQERISNLKSFFNQYDWKGINFPSHKEDKTNSKSIALKFYLCHTLLKT